LKGQRILVAGSRAAKLAAAVPVLERRDLEVQRVASSERALELAGSSPFDIALIDCPETEPALKDLLQGLMAAAHRWRRTYVVLVADTHRLEAARAQVGNGADALLSAEASAEQSIGLIHGLLGAPPRVSARASLRLELALLEGTSLVFRQTLDMSATGMLVGTSSALPVGTEASFRMDLPGARRPIEGKAQVVRHVLDPATAAVRAMGMRFVLLKGDDAARLQAFVDGALQSKV
jgi:CheY-like chemotaxis protein